MSTSTTELRQNIFTYFDNLLETGEPIYVERKGRLIKIIEAHEESGMNPKLERLQEQSALVDPKDDLIHTDWSNLWSPGSF